MPKVAQPASDIVARLSAERVSLGDRLAALVRNLRRTSEADMGIVERFVGQLERARAGHSAPQVGEALPPFVMPDQDGKLTSLDELLGATPLIVVFHRGHWCPYCRMTIRALAENQAALAPARLVAISAETRRYSQQIRGEAGAEFRFLSDVDAGYAMSIGLGVVINQELKDLYRRSGKMIPEFQGGQGWILPIPAVFVLDSNGIVRARHVNPDYRERMEVDELIRAVAAIG